MSDEAKLRQAVLDDPRADQPRLDYADWCDGQSDSPTKARAEFIRVQLELAGLDPEQVSRGVGHALATRAAQLLEVYDASWAGPLTQWTQAHAFRRGFIEHVKMSATNFLTQGTDVFAAAPVRHLDLSGVRDVTEAVFESALFAELTSLGLDRLGLYNIHMQLLAACPHVTALRWLSAANNNFDMDAYLAIGKSATLRSLTYAEFRGNPVDPVERLGMDGGEVVATHMPAAGETLESRLGRLEWLHRDEKPASRFAYG